MDGVDSGKPRHHWRRIIVLIWICDAAAVLGLIAAYFLAHSFHSSAPWILPSLVVGLIAILVLGASLVLPRRDSPP